MRHALVTGGAGFIGSHLTDRLLHDGWRVTVADNFDPFYAESIKRRNLAPHGDHPHFQLVELDLVDGEQIQARLSQPFDVIVHLAARAGVRPSIEDPVGYQRVNLLSTQNLLELARRQGVRQFVFASSSSVYGVNPRVPWSEDDAVLLPISPYASTKVSGELLGHVYSHLYGIRFLALRFFTVYGARQRPDLAVHKFARLIRAGSPLPIFGDGSARRDLTYIDDIISGVCAAMEYSQSGYEVINLGNHQTVTVLEMVRVLEECLGTTARLDFLPAQPGDVPQTWARVEKAARLLGYAPATPYAQGARRFCDWFLTTCAC